VEEQPDDHPGGGLRGHLWGGAYRLQDGDPPHPGITELRVGQIFPIAFGLLFGPAGAWGRPSATSSATSSEEPWGRVRSPGLSGISF